MPAVKTLATNTVCTALPHAVNYGRFCFWGRQSVFFVVYEIYREPLNGFAPNSHGTCLIPHSDGIEGQGQMSKVKDKGHQGQKQHFGPFGGLRAVYEW